MILSDLQIAERLKENMRSIKSIAQMIILLACIVFASNLAAQSPKDTESERKFWVFLADKGQLSDDDMDQNLKSLALKAKPKNLQRRSVTIKDDQLFDFTDLPVSDFYLDSLRALGVQVKRVSKWLNAVSVNGDEAIIRNLPSHDFVDSIAEVKVFKRDLPQEETGIDVSLKPTHSYSLDYGASLDQNLQINVPLLHDQGLSGDGVLIGVFDTGFDTDHPAFMSLEIVQTYDFINNDTNVRDDFDLQRSHGTEVLSCLGGYAPGTLIGPAYKASVCLAKTEIRDEEIQQEEDNFIAALEWAEDLGCQIVSASLGYIDWYTINDLDGNTALVSIASDLAVKKGMVVIVAAGNEGNSPTSIIAPADGDSVIAVGAVDANGDLAGFSSRGPSADGQIKPDICARGISVHQAKHTGGYGTGNGTSYATPIAAGAVALMMENDPDLTPIEIRDAIWQTGVRQAGLTYPNNDYGYGILNIAAAADYKPAVTTRDILAYPNPFTDFVNIACNVSGPGTLRGSIHTIDGIKIWESSVATIGDQEILTWDGKNVADDDAANGVYIFHVEGPGLDATTKLVKIK
jgi:serine protease AprX